MALQPGTKLGPYEILSPIGTGNGCETYKASDAQSSRTVAIKVLPAEWAGGADARTVAALNHPHICALHEITQQDGIDFAVMDLPEGSTLAARLDRGALDLREALTVAIAIADALNQAHRAGVTHGALTPANVILTKDGAKVLGFGLAGDPDLHYTAPEQLEGKDAGARGDIFALGAILYEMVAGNKAFEGKSRAALIATIATAEPDPLPAKAPRALEHVVQRCLAKDPEKRWQTAHDLMVQLRWIGGGDAQAAASGPQPKRERLIRWLLIATAFLVAALALPAGLYVRGPGEPEAFQIRIPVRGLSAANIALSPDGGTIALVARPNPQEPSSLYVRRVGALAFQRLGGTDDAVQPFWSPDNRFIAFVAGGRLKKVSASGGAPQDIAEAQGFTGGAWNGEGTILFGSAKGLFRVSAEGGKPAAATTLDAQETGHFWPNFLPDGRRFLYLAWSGQAANRAVFVGKLDSKDKTRLLAAESNPAYAPGYVLFHREASLFAQPFDAKNAALTGEPVHVADEVAANSANGRGSFDVSQNGVLLYLQGPGIAFGGPAGRGQAIANARFIWVDRTGRNVADAGEAGTYGDMDLSPDGKLIAITRQDAGAPGADIWTIDWQRAGVATRLTLNPEDDINPVWSPDGTRIAFTTYRKGNADIYVRNATDAGAETPLLETSGDEMVEAWSKDGRYLAYLSGPDEFRDIYALPLFGDQKPFPVLQGHFRKNEPQFSPDGKWLAYTSDKSGAFQVYVMAFPAGDQNLMVSKDGGGQPRWRRDGRELYYRMTDGKMMAVDIQAGTKLESGVPRVLFSAFPSISAGDPMRHQMAITPDGQRFLLRGNPGGRGGTGGIPTAPLNAGQAAGLGGGRGQAITRGLTVIQHWPSGLGKAGR